MVKEILTGSRRPSRNEDDDDGDGGGGCGGGGGHHDRSHSLPDFRSCEDGGVGDGRPPRTSSPPRPQDDSGAARTARTGQERRSAFRRLFERNRPSRDAVGDSSAENLPAVVASASDSGNGGGGGRDYKESKDGPKEIKKRNYLDVPTGPV